MWVLENNETWFLLWHCLTTDTAPTSTSQHKRSRMKELATPMYLACMYWWFFSYILRNPCNCIINTCTDSSCIKIRCSFEYRTKMYQQCRISCIVACTSRKLVHAWWGHGCRFQSSAHMPGPVQHLLMLRVRFIYFMCRLICKVKSASSHACVRSWVSIVFISFLFIRTTPECVMWVPVDFLLGQVMYGYL